MNSQINNHHEKWKLNYFPPSGGKYSAFISVYETEIRLVINDSKNVNQIIIRKDEISSVIERSSMVNKSVVISIQGQLHKFASYFMDTKKFISQLKIHPFNQDNIKEKAVKI